ncbi:MAG: HEAT repeat domain-containing protein [Planctomycetota bacterium]|nr:HEAT repeat domain-containing protein [Planctomycetota bacterium]
MAALLLLASPIACQRSEQGDALRAQALLAEFREAKPYPNAWEDTQPTTDRTGAGRNRLEIGRDLVKLDCSAVPLLIKALDDPDPQVSAVAALALGRIGDSRAVEPLLKVLQSFVPVSKSDSNMPPPGHLRAAACVCALGWLREPRAVGPIVALELMPNEPSDLIKELGFQDDSWDYMCGIMSIVCGDAIHKIGLAAAPELVRLLSDADGRIRSLAAEHLGRFAANDGRFNGGILMAAQPGPDPDEPAERRKEREALERAAIDRVAALAGGKLIELLHDKESHVRWHAASTLGNLRVASAVGPLIECLQDEHPWVRTSAIFSLGQIGDPAALDALAPLIRNPGKDQSDYVEGAIGEIGGPKAFTLLKSGLQNADPDRRKAAVIGLFVLKTPEAVSLLITAVRDSNYLVRYHAADSLGYLKGSEAARAVEPLIAATRDENDGVRVAAIRGLGKIADLRGVDAVIAALKDPYFMARGDALEALGRIKDPRAVGPVKAMLKDPDSYMRFHAVSALADLNPPDLRECLQPMLDDKEQNVRDTAKSALDKAAKPAEGHTSKH